MKNNNTDYDESVLSDQRAKMGAADAGRRTVLRALTAGAAALVVTACGGSATTNDVQSSPTSPGGQPPPPGTPPPSGVNHAPVWQTISTIAFTQGVAATFSIAGYVSDADGDALTILKNSAALPAGVTYNAANKEFVYDGVGALGSTGGHVLTADDGRN